MVSEQLATAPAYSTYTYTYENESWGDQLTAYNNVPLAYDSLGNPLAYSNGSSYTFTWAKGRQLTNVTKGSNSFAFTYDAEGRRTSKVSYSNRTVYYVWDGDRLIGEYVPYESTYIYLYDAEGSVIGFKYKDETGYYTGGAIYTYYYEKNLQGDIVGIIDENGNKFVEYTYDAWGNMLSRTMLGSNLWSLHYNLAESNPFLYRGYYYDRETGFYYLRSRYYDPVIGRFINADGYVNANGDLIGYNMYAYCSNNPVMFTDSSGNWIESGFDILSLGFSILDVACNPYDIMAWIGLIGDTVDLIPIVSGVGETVRAIRGTRKVAEAVIETVDTVHDVSRAADKVDDTIDTYKALKKINKGNGLEVHHIVEKRFEKTLNRKQSDMLSIALTPEDHRVFTNLWRKELPYGASYSQESIWQAAQRIYKAYPTLLDAAKKTIWG